MLNNNKKLGKIICFGIVVCLVFSMLCSCETKIKRTDAKAIFEDFFRAIKAEDYEKAEGYLHPDHQGALESSFSAIELSEKIDFQESIVIERYTSFSSSYYDSEYDGAKFTLVANARVSEVPVVIELTVVDNDDGRGVYHFLVSKR